MVLDAGAYHSLLSKDPSLFHTSAEVLPGKELADVEKALEQEIERIRTEPVENREIEKARNQLEAAFVYGQDSVFSQALLLGRYEIALNWKAIDDYLPSIRKVSAEDIQRVAKRYLIPDNRTVGMLLPLPPKEGKRTAPKSTLPGDVVR